MADSPLSAIEVLKHTDRSNCGKCGVPSCMGFSALVVAGQKNPDDCPVLGDGIKDSIRQKAGAGRAEAADRPETAISRVMEKFKSVEFNEAAPRLGGQLNGERMVIRCLGKIFELDKSGRMYSLCHVNNWVHFAMVQYVALGKGLDPVGEWVSFRDLKESRDWERFFMHQCHAAMQKLADNHTELFLDIVELFGREYKAEGPLSEHSVILYPLPKVPFMICYTPKDGPFESTLSIFFDRTIEANLKAEGTYLLGVGLVRMFTRIIEKHGQGENALARVNKIE